MTNDARVELVTVKGSVWYGWNHCPGLLDAVSQQNWPAVWCVIPIHPAGSPRKVGEAVVFCGGLGFRVIGPVSGKGSWHGYVYG